MSMNFGREQSLLRQRLSAVASPAVAAERQQQLGGATTFLGAADDEVQNAARDLADAYPQMGRAQMTAFVRTLWQSKIHELRAVGAELLAMRASLLEPADLPFVEGLLKDEVLDSVARRLGTEVLGTLVDKNKKLWKDLRRLAGASNLNLRRAALRGTSVPARGDAEAFPRFLELVEPMLASAEPDLLAVLDQVLAEIAEGHRDAVEAFAAQHGRKVKLPRKAKKPAVTLTPQAAPAKAAAAKKPTVKKAEAKPAPAKKAAKKPAAKNPARRTR